MINLLYRLVFFWDKPSYIPHQCGHRGEFSSILKVAQKALENGHFLEIHPHLDGKSYTLIPQEKGGWIFSLFEKLIWQKPTRNYQQAALFVAEFVEQNRSLLTNRFECQDEYQALQKIHEHLTIPNVKQRLKFVLDELDRKSSLYNNN